MYIQKLLTVHSAHGRCCTTGAFGAHGPGCTTGAFAAPGAAKQRPAPGLVRDNRNLCWAGHVYTIGALAAPERVYSIHIRDHCCAWTCLHTPQGPELHLDVVCTTGALKFIPYEIYEILYMGIITEFREILSNYATGNSANFRGILGNSARNTEVKEVQKTHGIPGYCHDSYPIDILNLSFIILCLLLLLLSFLWNETTTWAVLKNVCLKGWVVQKCIRVHCVHCKSQ